MDGSFPIAHGGAINVGARQTRFIGLSDIIAFKMRPNDNFFRAIMSRLMNLRGTVQFFRVFFDINNPAVKKDHNFRRFLNLLFPFYSSYLFFSFLSLLSFLSFFCPPVSIATFSSNARIRARLFLLNAAFLIIGSFKSDTGSHADTGSFAHTSRASSESLPTAHRR